MTPGDAGSHVVRVPRRNWSGQAADMRATLQTWDWRWKSLQAAQTVEIDFTQVEFMEPWALGMFACLGIGARAAGKRVAVALDANNPSNAFFERVGLRSVIEGEAPPIEAGGDPDTTGIRVVRTMREAELFAASAANLIRPVDESAADRVKYCVAEFGRNVIHHADAPFGGVAFAQRFPNLGAVQIVVCDAGRGVLDSLKPYYPELKTELEALRLAVLPQTSGARPPATYGGAENMGLGLFFSREIAWRAGGSFWLASGDALLGLLSTEANGPTRVYRQINRWNGTTVVIHIPDRAPSDFADVLSACYTLANELQRDPAGAGLEFVDSATEFPNGAVRLRVADVQDDLAAAHALRNEHLGPALASGAQVVLDFDGVKFLSTSVAQALLSDALRTPGSLTKLSFQSCSRATEMAIRTVAAYARAAYRRRPEF